MIHQRCRYRDRIDTSPWSCSAPAVSRLATAGGAARHAGLASPEITA
jgi:hypothetical protein